MYDLVDTMMMVRVLVETTMSNRTIDSYNWKLVRYKIMSTGTFT